jgi:hypothetical protein
MGVRKYPEIEIAEACELEFILRFDWALTSRVHLLQIHRTRYQWMTRHE